VIRALCLLAAVALALPAAAGVRPRYGGALAAAVVRGAIDPDPAQADSVAELFLAALLHQPLLRRAPDGALVPVLLAELPRSADGGSTFHLRLREGLRFHDGSPIRAADVAASLRRLAGGPWAALALPVRTIEVLGDRELRVALAFPCPRWPEALAEPAAAVVQQGASLRGAGPFQLRARGATHIELRPFAGHAGGRPFLDALTIRLVADRGAAARLAAAGEVAFGPGGTAQAPLATWLVAAPGVALPPVDPGDLARFLPASARRMEGLLPPPHRTVPPAPGEPGAPGGAPLELLFDPAVEGHQQVAERIQLRLHDRGVAVRLVSLAAEELRRRARGGDYRLALLQLPLPAEASFAAAALLYESGRGEAARALLARAGDEAEAILAEARGIAPLYAIHEAIGAVGRAPIHGGPDLADTWLLPEAPR